MPRNACLPIGAIRLGCENERFFTLNEKQEPLSLNDEQHYLADQHRARKARRRFHASGNCSRITSRSGLRAQQANAATVIFSLTRSEYINELAKMVHSLRRTRGNGLKNCGARDGGPACVIATNVCCWPAV
ncbi:cellulose biosynthesis protein BcsE [Pantoea agglomerans]|uniref:Cellulose biosynthesis protein BcsE n=1 Tax=Enterobacter agglomerans TaxID=549 RepID=A0A379ANN1_ENTAG|nr:cellulose biosynthesis protein BcsE [Pantoea agglomerans]